MSDGAATESGTTLEHELERMLEIERFEPPESFRTNALLSDPAVYEQAAADPQAWWSAQAESLDWVERWDTVLDDSNPPFYKWFVGGKLNASHNCLDRHVEAGNGDRVAFHWRGGGGGGGGNTPPPPHPPAPEIAHHPKGRGGEAGGGGRPSTPA